MAGHSQFKNIMYRKGAQDAKRAKVFARLGREIMVAARSGADPQANAALRNAVANARAHNMPKTNIERAIKKGSGAGDGEAFEEIRYEGYGPGGVAVMVDTLTDNRNRTASDIRAAFSKFGGNLGETNSVGYLFDRVGSISYGPDAATADDMFEAALEAGATDVESAPAGHEITCAPDELPEVREALEARFGPPRNAALAWKPQTTVAVDEKSAASLFKLLEVLEDSDDVQSISANYEVPDEVMAALEAAG